MSVVMSELEKYWAGNITGTNTGKIFIELEENNGRITGVVRLSDDNLGISVLNITGTYKNSTLIVKGIPAETEEGTILGEVDVEATLTKERHLNGTWASSIGTGGAIYLFPQHRELTNQPDLDDQEFFTKTSHIGPIRLNINELKNITEVISQDFATVQLLISHNTNAGIVTKYAEAFFNTDYALDTVINKVKFFIQEPDKYGVFKQVVVEFNAEQINYALVQGVNQSWVAGKIEILKKTIKKYERQLLTSYKKWGLGLNQVIFLIMIIFATEIQDVYKRAIFVIFVVAILSILYWVHTHFIPIASISLRPNPLSKWQKYSPQVISAVIGVISTLVASLLFWALTGGQ
jgi:hypothetical protein